MSNKQCHRKRFTTGDGIVSSSVGLQNCFVALLSHVCSTWQCRKKTLLKPGSQAARVWKGTSLSSLWTAQSVSSSTHSLSEVFVPSYPACSVLACSGAKRLWRGSTIFSLLLNTCSDAILVAGTYTKVLPCHFCYGLIALLVHKSIVTTKYSLSASLGFIVTP